MWILPKQLHTSAYVPDTAALISDLAEQSQICELSLLARSKPSLARTWSQKWKRDSWTQHLSGRILKPSHGQTFVTAWTSSLEVIPASHSAQPGSDSDEMTPDTSGLGLQMELFPCDPESASLKTSRDTSASALEKLLASWKDLVTLRRGEYSQRVKLAHLTNERGSSSWPSPRLNMHKGASMGCCGGRIEKTGYHGNIEEAVYLAEHSGLPAPVKPSTDLSRPESWETPTVSTGGHRQADGSMTPKLDQQVKSWKTPRACEAENPPMGLDKRHHGLTHQVTKTWATPRAGCPGSRAPGTGGKVLEEHVRGGNWATPQSRDAKGAEGRMMREGKLADLPSQTEVAPTGQWNRANGKLNPRWVETLMNLPVGWTMPSCASPVTIVPTNCVCWETESSLPPQPELF